MTSIELNSLCSEATIIILDAQVEIVGLENSSNHLMSALWRERASGLPLCIGAKIEKICEEIGC